MTKLIISLTTIPPRFPYIRDNLAAVLDQTADVAAIELNIARKYRRFEYDPTDLPEMPPGVTLRLMDSDLGPASKVLPTVQAYRGQDVLILFGDDDKVYDRNWAQRFVDAAAEHPDCAICEVGGMIASDKYAGDSWISPRHPQAGYLKKNLAYRLKRAASLGRWKPSKAVSSGYTDILEGWGGALVRPTFFDEIDYDIPDVLWTVDDVWLSGCLERKGIPIWLNAAGMVRSRAHTKAGSHEALRKFVYQGHDRVSANRACIEYFRKTWGIWGGTKG